MFSKEEASKSEYQCTAKEHLLVLSSPSLEAPTGVFKLYLVPCCPFGIDGLLSDEAVTPALRVLVDLVHPALVDSVPLIVMVRNSAVIGSTVRRRCKRLGRG